MAAEWRYLVLILVLFVVPRALQRFRIPSAVTSFAGGAACALFVVPLEGDTVIQLFSTLGIVSLFLFAGLEIPVRELRGAGPVLSQHLLISAIIFAGAAWLCGWLFDLGMRPASLVALALVTPSTGFILDSIRSFDLGENEKFWIKSKAIAAELLALGGLFVILQSTSWLTLIGSVVVLGAVVIVVPLAFRSFAKWVMPYAPRSEFAFLLMVALLCAAVTKKLGVYYLVGAFVVGLAAQRFRELLPGIASKRMVEAVELFASFFIPFYFFRAGLGMSGEALSLAGLAIGFVLLGAAIPLRVGWIVTHRWLALREAPRDGARIAACLLPTLVFTLVLAEILRERFGLDEGLVGGLVVYALANTLIPAFFFKLPLPEYTAPRLDGEPPFGLPGGGGEAQPAPLTRTVPSSREETP